MIKYLSFDPAIRTLAYSIINIDKTTNKPSLERCELLDLTKGKKVKSCTFDENMTELINQLEQIKTDGIDAVLIENIPSQMNPLIKSISIGIYTFFKVKKFDVKFVSPSRKLKDNKVSYRQRKKQSVIDATDYLTTDDVAKVTKHTKIDDITDTILQCKAYHEKLKTASHKKTNNI